MTGEPVIMAVGNASTCVFHFSAPELASTAMSHAPLPTNLLPFQNALLPA